MIDRLDERRAVRLRAVLGKDRWLVSWQYEGDRRWRARLSCSLLVSTLERTGRTRTEAIGRAAQALDRLLTLRDIFHRREIRVHWDSQAFDDPRH
jgi:hypothetical protein